MSHLTVTHTIKQLPAIDFSTIKKCVIGANYELSLALVGTTRARAINQSTRSKDYIPNILSFPLTETAGEIYLCPAVATREAHRYGRTAAEHITFLFIHGLLHLKGMDHGPAMEQLETRWCRRFNCLGHPQE